MIAGFTGTRKGMTEQQRRNLSLLLVTMDISELHHGDCQGSDEQAAEMADSLGIMTVSHPPQDDKLRAYHFSDEVLSPASYLDRDRDIVDVATIIFAATLSDRPSYTSRSGTWYTIRYARRQGVPVVML